MSHGSWYSQLNTQEKVKGNKLCSGKLLCYELLEDHYPGNNMYPIIPFGCAFALQSGDLGFTERWGSFPGNWEKTVFPIPFHNWLIVKKNEFRHRFWFQERKEISSRDRDEGNVSARLQNPSEQLWTTASRWKCGGNQTVDAPRAPCRVSELLFMSGKEYGKSQRGLNLMRSHLSAVIAIQSHLFLSRWIRVTDTTWIWL